MRLYLVQINFGLGVQMAHCNPPSYATDCTPHIWHIFESDKKMTQKISQGCKRSHQRRVWCIYQRYYMVRFRGTQTLSPFFSKTTVSSPSVKPQGRFFIFNRFSDLPTCWLSCVRLKNGVYCIQPGRGCVCICVSKKYFWVASFHHKIVEKKLLQTDSFFLTFRGKRIKGWHKNINLIFY